MVSEEERARGEDERAPRFSIPTRIFLAFALTLAGFAGVSVSSVFQHDRSARMLQLLHDGYLPLAMRLGEARSYQNGYRRHVENILDDESEHVWFQAARQVRPSTVRRLRYFLERAERLAARVGDETTLVPVREAVEAIERGYAETNADYDLLLEALEAGDRDRAEDVHRRLKRAELDIEREYREGYGKLVDRIDALASTASEQGRQASIVLGVLAALALFLGIAATLWSQRVLRPLPLLQSRVGRIAEGEFDVPPLEVRGSDELARLARDFDEMVAALRARDARLSELRRMQSQIVEGLRAAVVVVDAEGRVATVNPAARVLFGVAEVEVAAPFEVAPLASTLERVRSEGAPVVLEAVAVGDRRADVLATTFGDHAGSVLVVADDVTEALRTKDRLILTERLAAIGRMAAHVTHEVRNPLSSIGLNVDMLRDEVQELAAAGGAESDEAFALVAAIQKEIDRLTEITEQYLRLARLPRPRFEEEDLGEIVESLTRFIGRDVESRGVRLQVEVEEGLPAVALDEQQIRQALLNLVRNAVDASTRGDEVRVFVTRSGDGVRVVVEDDGDGVPEGERDAIFDLFFTTKERGSGLGLPLTQQVVHAHEGTITIEASPSGGARFVVDLPGGAT